MSVSDTTSNSDDELEFASKRSKLNRWTNAKCEVCGLPDQCARVCKKGRRSEYEKGFGTFLLCDKLVGSDIAV